jgi:tRNA(fMet)-specific endonuclease VapC
MRVLLDTNAYADLRRGREAVVERIRAAEEVLLSSVVAGELLYGFRLGSRFKRNLTELEAFLARPFVRFVPVTRVTADRYARIASTLRRKGTPIPTNDIWIAAHAVETGADLLSSDEHFSLVDGVAWLDPGA